MPKKSKSDANADEVAISIEKLTKVFNRQNNEPILAVENLSLQVPAGRVFGLLGPNGAGKTTTIKLICGLIKPTLGRIKLFGNHVEKQHSLAMSQIGVVLEGTRNIYWRLTVWQNLMYFAGLKGVRSEEVKDVAMNLLVDLRLIDRKDQRAGELSRGMQQKVAIACALIADPPIILLDEPTLGLDYQSAQTIEHWIRQQAKENDRTIVVTTHQLDMAQRVCDQIGIMIEGQLKVTAPTRELLKAKQQTNYTIRLRGQLDIADGALRDFGGKCETHYTPGEDLTTIKCEDIDQDQLNRILDGLRERRLPLVEVSRDVPTLTDIFVSMVNDRR
ncbi:MAG: ABC transporter ATP-binding protein [Chloroflexia bacterium]